MARKKQADLLKAKQKKQKIFVAIGLVGLLAAAAIEVPMIMKQSGGGSTTAPPPPTETTPAPAGTSSLAPPTPATTTATTATAGVGQLVDTDVPPQQSQDRLVGFSLFPSKDPFVQQIIPPGSAPSTGTTTTTTTTGQTQPGTAGSGAASGGGTSGGGSSGAGSSGAVVPPSAGTDPSSGSTGSSGSSGTTETAKTVTISVNGKNEEVGKGGTFPASSPTFRLVSFGDDTAQIGIVGGTYATGGQTVTLKKGVPVTLVNTSDGTRYRIVLVKTP